MLLAPEARVVGVHCSEVRVAGGAARLIEAVWELLLRVAVTTAVWLSETVPAVARKVAVVLEAATVTETGTVRAEVLSDRATVMPPAGAEADRVRVQVLLAPEARVAGVHCSDDTEYVATGGGGMSMRVVDCDPPAYLAVIAAV